MKILIVIDDYFNKSNGMSISTQRFVQEFKKMGHQVRVLSSNAGGEPDYALPQKKIPIFQGLVDEQGFHFAQPEENKIKEAVSWADIVHIEDPFLLSQAAVKVAKEMNKPITGTFHLYPENMTASVPNLDLQILNSLIMKYFRDRAYKYCDMIQCPTDKVKQRLRENDYRSKLVTISNGISSDFINLKRVPRSVQKQDPFTILCIGRFSHEKDQVTLFNALHQSKHGNEINVIFAGKGPLQKEYEALNADLPKPGILAYLPQEHLKRFMAYTDLVVHCANVEVEGMSCMEAFAAGCVPVIAKSALSSTAEYALSTNNVYAAGNSTELARRIDYWFEQPQRLIEYSDRYRLYAKNLSVKKSAYHVIKMMEKAGKEHKEKA